MEIVKCINYIHAFVPVTVCIISISPHEGEILHSYYSSSAQFPACQLHRNEWCN
jgi:hypothetical protein